MSRLTRKIALTTAIALAALGTITGCSSDDDKGSGASAEGGKEFSVYATTGYLADAINNIAPKAKVTTMVGPGGDPHTYEPSTKDIETIQKSDLVFWNGLHLEAQMIKMLTDLGDKQLCVGDKIPEDMLLDWPETDDEGNALHDPHIWNSPEIWSLVVEQIADRFAEADPDSAQMYKDNAAAYVKKIEEAVAKHKETLASIPDDQRLLVTGHDAFNYFGRTFNLEIEATDFVSSEAQKSPKEISELADKIVAHKTPVIFQDNLADPQAIKSLKEAVESRGHKVEISHKELFADSLGAEAPVNTYLGALEHNVTAVAEALGAK